MGDGSGESHREESMTSDRVREYPIVREPSWEPSSVDSSGQPRTQADSKAVRSGRSGQPWTAVDTAWRSTDQEVGGSSPSGRASKGLLRRGFRRAWGG
jgi:hypothetical protein